MALIYQARIVPSKIELLSAWLPSQPWWTGDADALEMLGAFRFDDPAGAVGIETHLVRAADGPIVQVPLTYRGAPLDGADSALICTMSHSVLGPRWIYDGCADPVYAGVLATTIATGATQADLQVETADGFVIREPTTWVQGSGTGAPAVAPIETVTVTTDQSSTTIGTGAAELVVLRVLDAAPPPSAAGTLTGTWAGTEQPVLLAFAR